MSVKLRFRRMGRRKAPVFSLVATDSRSPRDGRFIEDLGRYEPLLEPARVKFDEDRVVYWLGQGAQPSDTVRNLLQKEGILLRSAMTRRGEAPEAIETAVAEFKERQSTKTPAKKTVAERRAEALEAERSAAAEKAAELEKARQEREAELAKQRAEAEAAARAEAEAARDEAAAAAADSEALTTAADATDASSETEAVPTNDSSDEGEAAAEAATEETVAEAAPDAAEEQPAVDEDTTEEVAADTGAEVADQADAGASEADTVETAADTTEADPVEADAAEAEAAKPAEVVDTPDVADATEAEIADEGETVAASDQPASGDVATGTAQLDGDDLTRLKGVGPTYASILRDADVVTYAQLAELTVDRIQEMITEAGSTTAGNEETWPEQARLLAAGDVAGFEAYAETL